MNRLLLPFLLASLPAFAGTPPAGFTDTLVVSTCCPTAIAFHPVTGELWWVSRGDGSGNGVGWVRVLSGATTTTAATIASVDSTGERGVLGLAFDPDYANHPNVYVYYTMHDPETQNVCASGPEAHNRVVRFDESGHLLSNPVPILEGPALTCAWNHNAGAIHFGADGRLYVVMGDNAIVGAAPSAQDHGDLRGKLLRIARDGTIPPDNPFVGQAGWRPEIWALGLRNPFRFSVDPSTGNLYIADVGQNTWEEVDLGVRGANYGWPTVEGPSPSGVSGMTYPTFWYGHTAASDPNGCAITGGPVYRGTAFPADYRGNYYFGDYCTNFIRRAHLSPSGGITSTEPFVSNTSTLVDIAEGPDGCLYYAQNAGTIRKVCATAGGNRAPIAAASATPSSGLPTLDVSFSSAGSSDPDGNPLTYGWLFGDGQWSTAANPTHGYPTNGVYPATLTVDDGTGAANASDLSPPLRVVVGNRAPTASIASPSDGAFYCAGQTASYAGSATDPEDGALPGSSLSFTVTFHHATHMHPFLGPIAGASGSFTIPTTGETAADVWYEIRLDAQDSGAPIGASGVLSGSKSIALLPTTAPLTLATIPGGFPLTLDSQPFTSPQTVTRVCGLRQTHGAAATQTLSGRSYAFAAWSDGAGATHDVTNPAAATTFKARYHCSPSLVATDLHLTKLTGGQIGAAWIGGNGACAGGSWRIWRAGTPTPVSTVGFFPDDPLFTTVKTSTGTVTTFTPPAGDGYFLVTSVDPGGFDGPPGSY